MKQLSLLIGINTFVFALYAGASIVSYSLVFPPEGYRIVCLSAGVGLAAVIIFGRGALTGVILGALVSDSIYHLDLSSLNTMLTSSTYIFVLVVSVVLQIEVAYRLIEKYVDLDNPLIELRDTSLFFLLAGPVASLAGAIFGVLASTFIGVIPVERFFESLLIWWQCNNLAVLIVLPLMMVLFRKPKNNWKIRFFTIAIPLGFCFGVLLYHLSDVIALEDEKLKANMSSDVDNIHRQIEQGFELKEQAVWTTERLLSVTPIQGEDFVVAANRIIERFDGIQALAIFERVDHKDRLYYEEHILKASILSFDEDKELHTPDINQKFYFVGIKIINNLPVEERFGGLDLLSVKRVVPLINEVISTKTSQSSRLKLLAGSSREGNVLVSPLFRNPSSPYYDADSGEIKGFIIITYSIKALIKKALSIFPSRSLDIEILENNEIQYSNLVERPFGYTEADWVVIKEIHTLGKRWLVRYTPNANFKLANSEEGMWFLAVIETFFIAFIGITLYLITGQSVGRERIVKSRTARLRQEVLHRNRTNKQQLLRNDVLESIAESDNLETIFDQIVTLVEQYQDGLSVGIYILSADRTSLTLRSGMNLQPDIRHHLSHVSVGYGNTGLGHCAYTGEMIFINNVDTHPYWISKAAVLNQTGFNSCWAIPIISSEKRLLGVFGIYLSDRLLPLEEDIPWIHQVASLISIAIEKNGAEQEVEHLAYYDSLTELPNRRLLMSRLRAETRRAVEHRCYGAALFIDLDHFKTLNDALGHHYGDKLLGQLSNRLKRTVGANILARWGGDEFVLLVPAYYKSFDAVSSGAIYIAEKVRAIFEQPFDLDGYSHSITCSIGVAPFHENNTDPDDILKQADAAMYHAKAVGRNHVSMHEEKMQTMADSRLTIEKNLHDALSNGGFELVYQPQFKQDKTLVGAEVLIRWPKDVVSDVTTEQFISIAEDSDLIVDIGVWIINNVCEQLVLWPALPSISINISPKHFHRDDFIEILEASVVKNKLSSNRIVIEITERTMLDDIDNTVEQMRKLRDMNIRISIDDFGTGYSSLAYISRLPIDQLKIDQSFINTIGKEQSTIVDAIFSIAKSLHLEVVAEGVETQAQLEYLCEKQCDIYQGYLFAYPLGKKDFGDLLTSAKL
jgi:diguanylate cyclase (GGDEF)-like protein